MKTEQKMFPKMTHCRICGRGYIDPKEAEACARDHGKKNKDNIPRFKRLYK